jgi:GTP-binding protein EngB required for normal cell division
VDEIRRQQENGVRKVSIPGFGFSECSLAKEIQQKISSKRMTEYDIKFQKELRIQRTFMDAENKAKK